MKNTSYFKALRLFAKSPSEPYAQAVFTCWIAIQLNSKTALQFEEKFMKNILAISIIGLAGVPAIANDGGMPYIQVKSVEVKSTSKGPVIKVKDGDAFKLYSVLPKDYVYDISRSLTITSDKKSVTIFCKSDSKLTDADGNPVTDPTKVVCTISTGAAFDSKDEFNNPMPWQPACQH